MRRDCGLEGPSNFRDLGGYQAADGRIVRWRRIFRSDALRLTDADVAVLRDEIGLRLVIDLRTGFEFGHRDGGGNENYVRRNLAVGAQRVHLPMVDETRIQRQASDERPIAARSYLKMFERGGPALAEAFSLIAEPDNHPLVFHCAAGKDRTGILAAMLLGLLGVDDDTIVADYALSQANMARPGEDPGPTRRRAHPRPSTAGQLRGAGGGVDRLRGGRPCHLRDLGGGRPAGRSRRRRREAPARAAVDRLTD
ncbi:MAG: tyrosine-protein phosphatase [Acidimicrobiales bacterium]